MEPQCRLCLCKNFPLKSIATAELEQVYYSLTLLPVAKSKPLLACYICLGHLRKVYKLKMNFLKADEHLRLNMNVKLKNQMSNPPRLHCILSVSVLQQDNIYPVMEDRVVNKDHNGVCEVKPEIKEEIVEDEVDVELDQGNHHSGCDNQDATQIRTEDVKNGAKLDKTTTMYNNGTNNLAITVVKIEPIEHYSQDIDNLSYEHGINSGHFNNYDSVKQNDNRKSIFLEFEVPNLTSNEQNTVQSAPNDNSFNQTIEKPFICEYCQKAFTYPSKLENHMRVHINVKRFKCGTCDKEFYSQFALVHHSKLHEKDTSLNCKVCDKTFTSRSHLKRHARIHTGLKPFNCDSCQKTFGNRDSLKKHSLIHSNVKAFKCEVCQKSFLYRSSLNIHNRMHTDERHYICDVCQKSFRHRHNLIEHLFIHDKTKSFKCATCHKSFTYRCNLKRHTALCTEKTA